MDQKILFVVLGAAALALAGLAFATGGQGMARGWQGDENATGCNMMPEWAGNGNETCANAKNLAGMPRFNETAHEEFEAAVESGDFASATKLHEEYGFGGPMFEKLNATTFAKFSQMHRLRSELAADLGMENGPAMMGRAGFGRMQGGKGMQGMKSGLGRMGPEFAKGMRHGFNQGANQTTQE